MYKFNDLTGMTFGRLEVIEQNGRTSDRHILWKCKCEIDSADKLGSALLENISNTDKLKAFCDLVDGDLSIDWKQMIMYLNNEENRYLAEFMDAILPELMSGRIELNDNG